MLAAAGGCLTAAWMMPGIGVSSAWCRPEFCPIATVAGLGT